MCCENCELDPRYILELTQNTFLSDKVNVLKERSRPYALSLFPE